jgi:hypothetical protein
MTKTALTHDWTAKINDDVRGLLGARLVACKESNQALGAESSLIGFLSQACVVSHTLLKAPPGQAPEKRPNRAFPRSHPPPEQFRERGIRADAGGADGASSGCVVKKRRENFGHRPLFRPLI